ncbi:PAS domain-containing protein, partial [Candidatus Bipolaricaulota bacterium]|nr:PAS domain-containing protein [Candidatus Bipolaricaulota bacterium]
MTFDLSNEKLNNLLRPLDWRNDTPIVALNDSGEVVLFNSGAKQLLGFNPEEMVGNHVSDLLVGIDKREVNNLFFPETGNRPSGEFSFKTKRDESQDINWNVLYTDGQDGQSELAICLGDPQSEEEIGEQSTPNCTPVRETVLKYKTLFQYAYDAMVLSRFETGRIIEVNPEAENLLGYRTEELLRKRLPDLLADGDFSRLKEKLTEDKFFYQADQPLQKK